MLDPKQLFPNCPCELHLHTVCRPVHGSWPPAFKAQVGKHWYWSGTADELHEWLLTGRGAMWLVDEWHESGYPIVDISDGQHICITHGQISPQEAEVGHD